MFQFIVGISLAPPPTGTVTFYSGNTVLGTATVTQTTLTEPFINSAASLNVTNLPVGTDSNTAKYSGDANYEAATSNAVQVIVTKQPLGSLTASANALAACDAGPDGDGQCRGGGTDNPLLQDRSFSTRMVREVPGVPVRTS